MSSYTKVFFFFSPCFNSHRVCSLIKFTSKNNTSNKWLGLTKEGVPSGPTSFSHILLLSCQTFWPVLFVSVTLMETLLLTQKINK